MKIKTISLSLNIKIKLLQFLFPLIICLFVSCQSQTQSVQINKNLTPTIQDVNFVELWNKQQKIASEKRKEETGNKAKGLSIPVELKDTNKQNAKLAELSKNDPSFLPLDYVDLTKLINDKKLISVPIASETYFVKKSELTGSSAFQKFTPEGS